MSFGAPEFADNSLGLGVTIRVNGASDGQSIKWTTTPPAIGLEKVLEHQTGEELMLSEFPRAIGYASKAERLLRVAIAAYGLLLPRATNFHLRFIENHQDFRPHFIWQLLPPANQPLQISVK